jgi:ABC-type lipoprotein release transport system permease subunit
MKIPLIRGRAFHEAERLENAHSAIVSEAFAGEFFRGEDAIGKHLRLDAGGGVADYQIVGIAGDTPYLISESIRPMMYVPLLGGAALFNEAALAVRTRVNPISLALPIQKEIARLDPELAVADILTMDQRIGMSTSAAAFDTSLIFGFAMLSLALAAIGLYGVLSYVVTQRTPELGIRLALGAKRAELVRLVLLDGMRPAVVGMAFGLAAGLAAARLVKAMLFGVQPTDASIFVAVPLVLLGVAALACLLPAWRASMLDPIRALRLE